MYRVQMILKAIVDKIVALKIRCDALEEAGAILTHGSIKAQDGSSFLMDNQAKNFVLPMGLYIYVNSHIYVNHIYLLSVTNSSSLAPRLQLIGGSTAGTLSIQASAYGNIEENKWTVALKTTGQARGYLYKLGNQVTV